MVLKIKSVVISAFIAAIIVTLSMPMLLTESANPYHWIYLGSLYNNSFTWITIGLFVIGLPMSYVSKKLIGRLQLQSELVSHILVFLSYMLATFILYALFFNGAIEGGLVILIIPVAVYFVINDLLINGGNKKIINRFIQWGIFCYLASMILVSMS